MKNGHVCPVESGCHTQVEGLAWQWPRGRKKLKASLAVRPQHSGLLWESSAQRSPGLAVKSEVTS